MSRLLRAVTPIVLGILLCACLVAEQDADYPKRRTATIHLDTGYNLAMVVGRSLAIAVVGLWFASLPRDRRAKLAIGGVVLAGAGLLLWQGMTRVKGYRIEVTDATLEIQIPHAEPVSLPWKTIDGIELRGFRKGEEPPDTKFGPHTESLTDNPYWESLEITTSDGGSYLLNLKPLTMTNREILWRLIASHAQLRGK